MPVEYRTGDLFEYKGSLAHGVNAAGAMGKGIAVEFKRRYPKMYEEYRKRCKAGKFLLGSLYPHIQISMRREEAMPANVAFTGLAWSYRQIWIYNLCIKAHWSLPADEIALWATMRAMVKHMEANNVSEVAMPCIGAGLGQLDWETVVKPIIEEVGASTACNLIVYMR